MQSHYIRYKNSSIHYRQFGVGPRLLFCFHGYGRDSYTFTFLEKRLSTLFTIVAIDIPFHGMTDWKDELIFNPTDLTQFLLGIRSRLGKDDRQFTLLGFSMGGRIALFLTQLLPELVDRLVLLAPDGLTFNFWRWFGSRTWIGSTLLHYSIHHPGWFIWLLNRAEKWQLIHRSLADFVRYYLFEEEHRKTLYRRWISMRRFNPAKGKLKRLIQLHRIKVRMLFGAFDRVIPYGGGQRFKEGIEELASLQIVEAGHHLLSEVHAEKIVRLIID